MMLRIFQTVVVPCQRAVRQGCINMRPEVKALSINLLENTSCLWSKCRYTFHRNLCCRNEKKVIYNLRTFCGAMVLQSVAARHIIVNAGAETRLSKQQSLIVADKKGNILLRTWIFVKMICRILQLCVIFSPLFILSPLLWMGKNCRKFWFKFFVFDVEISGPVIVKLGQWASTRRDLFSEEFCLCLSKLQRRTKPHSWNHTEKILTNAYGPTWDQVILKINTVPIGSGCCAQVYKAWIHANISHSNGTKDRGLPDGDLLPVAVKVVHPNMNEHLRRDLTIMRAAASSITWLFPSLKWLSLEECVDDFAHLMTAQVDMCVEAQNLDRFAKNFADVATVRFPQPIWSLSQPDILVETFETGEPLLNYVTSTSVSTFNTLLADIGINTILKMVFDDNFAHGDLHPGNMLVQIVNTPEQNDSAVSVFKKSPTPSLRLVILDCGIVASLDECSKQGLRDVFTAVINGNGRKVAELFLAHSKHECPDIESFKQSMDKIVKGALDKTVTLDKIQVSSLMTSLFTAMISHKVKLDGSFSSIILAIMVLEGLGRSLDPTADIVKKAQPFLISAL